MDRELLPNAHNVSGRTLRRENAAPAAVLPPSSGSELLSVCSLFTVHEPPQFNASIRLIKGHGRHGNSLALTTKLDHMVVAALPRVRNCAMRSASAARPDCR